MIIIRRYGTLTCRINFINRYRTSDKHPSVNIALSLIAWIILGRTMPSLRSTINLKTNKSISFFEWCIHTIST